MAIVFLRTLIMFSVIIISMRLMGKRQLGELELSELVVAVMLSDMAAHPLQDIGIPIMNGIIPVLTLLCMELIISGAVMESTAFRKLICGKPSILIENGKVVQSAMRKNRFTLDELTEELRNQSILDIKHVKYAILETDGTLNVILYPDQQAVTASQMGIEVSDDGYPVIIINDGKLMTENLKIAGVNPSELKAEITKRGAASVSDVYLFSIDSGGNIYYELMEDSGK